MSAVLLDTRDPVPRYPSFLWPARFRHIGTRSGFCMHLQQQIRANRQPAVEAPRPKHPTLENLSPGPHDPIHLAQRDLHQPGVARRPDRHGARIEPGEFVAPPPPLHIDECHGIARQRDPGRLAEIAPPLPVVGLVALRRGRCPAPIPTGLARAVAQDDRHPSPLLEPAELGRGDRARSPVVDERADAHAGEGAAGCRQGQGEDERADRPPRRSAAKGSAVLRSVFGRPMHHRAPPYVQSGATVHGRHQASVKS